MQRKLAICSQMTHELDPDGNKFNKRRTEDVRIRQKTSCKKLL